MFTNSSSNQIGLEKAIDDLLSELDHIHGDDPKYNQISTQLTKLYELKKIDSSRRVSADTMAIVLGNLAGILVIVGHERAHIVTSKALNFMLKLK